MSKKMLISSLIFFAILAGILSYEITTLVEISHKTENEETTGDDAAIYEDEPAPSDNNVSEVVAADTTKPSKITPSTRIVYQYYYTLDDKLVTDECEPPYYLIDMTRQQLEEYYKDWQLISFSSTQVVLRQSINQRDTKGYFIIHEYGGKIAVFYDYTDDFSAAFEEAVALGQYKDGEENNYFEKFMAQNAEHYLREVVDTPVSVLPTSEQEKLKNGILVYGEDELIKLLESYTS